MLAEFLEEKLEKSPSIYHEEGYSRSRIRYYSKDLYLLLKEHLLWDEANKSLTVHLRQQDESQEFLTGFLRGLIDTDGYKEKRFRRYIYGSISESLRDNFSYALTELGIEHTNYVEQAVKDEWHSMHKVRISGNSAEKFSNKINPRPPKKSYA